jgi:hypothetical protein
MCARNTYMPVCARNMCINMCMPARSVCISVRNRCNTHAPVRTECLTGCCGCACVVVPNNNGHSGSFISDIFDKQETSNTLSFVLLSAFVLLAIQFSKSKHRPSF